MSRMILARRAAEDKRERAEAVVRDINRAVDIAVFEHRTQRKIDQRVAKEQVAGIQRRMAADVNRRRARLAELLSAEDDMYGQLLQETFESASQRKERLFAKAKALRAAREAKRREFVQKITADRWREGSDDLRTLDSQAIAKRCAEERVSQLQEAEDARWRAYEEEQKAAADWETLRQKKIEREIAEAKAKKARDEEMKQALNQQVRVRESLVRAEKEEEALSAKEMLARWDMERRAEVEKLEAAKRREKEEAARVRHENEEFAKVRAVKAARELAEDQRRLQESMERERALAELERQEAEERRQEAIRYRKHLEAQAAMEKEEATELDRMYLEEQEKMWKKRQDQWDREDAARKRLMEEVDRSRQQQMALKQALHDAEMAADAASAARIRQELVEKEEEDRLLIEQRRKAALEHQEDLLRQQAAKEAYQARLKQEAFLEYKLMLRAEEQYKARLAHMKAAGAPPKNHRRTTTKWYN